MLTDPRRQLPFLVLCCFLASCAQFNIYVTFPAETIQKAAEKIEEEVRQGKSVPAASEQPKQPQSRNRRYYFLPTLDFQSALAEAPVDLNVTTPGIRKKIESRQARYQMLKPYLDKGILGEGAKGMLAIRGLSGLSGRDKVTVNRLLKAENRDREDLVAELARANNFDPKMAAKIAKPFADAIRAKMEKGHWFQDDAGNWKQK